MDDIQLDTRIGAQGYCNLGACEAGLFDASFACTDTETERCAVGGTVVRLCVTHKNVITIKPTAETNDQ